MYDMSCLQVAWDITSYPNMKATCSMRLFFTTKVHYHSTPNALSRFNLFHFELQGGGTQSCGSVECAILVCVQDVRKRQHRRPRACPHEGLCAQGVQR